jgi:hypothetical protein
MARSRSPCRAYARPATPGDRQRLRCLDRRADGLGQVGRREGLIGGRRTVLRIQGYGSGRPQRQCARQTQPDSVGAGLGSVRCPSCLLGLSEHQPAARHQLQEVDPPVIGDVVDLFTADYVEGRRGLSRLAGVEEGDREDCRGARCDDQLT